MISCMVQETPTCELNIYKYPVVPRHYFYFTMVNSRLFYSNFP